MEGKNTSNIQELEYDPLGRTPLQVGIEVTIAVLICIACIVGNSLVVVTIHRNPRLNSITNMLVENLAWTDIIMAAPAILDSKHAQRSVVIWSLGLQVCWLF